MENRALLSEFRNSLELRNLSQKTRDKHVSNGDFYINDFLLYEVTEGPSEGISRLDSFLGLWFIRKAPRSEKTLPVSNISIPFCTKKERCVQKIEDPAFTPERQRRKVVMPFSDNYKLLQLHIPEDKDKPDNCQNQATPQGCTEKSQPAEVDKSGAHPGDEEPVTPCGIQAEDSPSRITARTEALPYPHGSDGQYQYNEKCGRRPGPGHPG